jgi:hypothetical protein
VLGPDRPHRGRARRVRPGDDLYEQILALFWENHDPTQGMRQGNDVGTQYRSALYASTPEQVAAAERSRDAYQARLGESGYGEITTEIGPAGDFFYAEEYHQQYLAKNPNGYCGHRRHRRELPDRPQRLAGRRPRGGRTVRTTISGGAPSRTGKPLMPTPRVMKRCRPPSTTWPPAYRSP